jgi:hypothetical protein
MIELISFMIEDTKDCMQKLLKDTVFNDFLCVQFELVHIYKVSVDGQLRFESLSEEDKATYENRKYILWNDFQSTAYEMVKGNKTPTSMKIVFSLNQKAKQNLLSRIPSIDENAITNFTFILTYESKRIKVVTGTNYATFILDKEAERYFDDSMLKFFKKHMINTLLALD